MRQSIRIGTYAGIPVGVNWSVLVIFALVTWELADYVFPQTYGGGVRAGYWVAAVVAAVLFFASLLAHELSHAVVARHNGVGVRSITLWLFGGVAQLQGEAHDAGADFRIAAIGPTTSALLGGVFGATEAGAHFVGLTGLPVDVLSWLWKINLLLAVFNLIPGAPLDGGRILRAGLWKLRGDRIRASVAAARAGRFFGLVLVVLGFAAFAYYDDAFFLWPSVLGWFLWSAAGSEERVARLRGGVAQLAAWQVMSPNPPSLPQTSTVAEMVGTLWNYRGEALAVTDERGWLSGLVTAQAVRAVPEAQRHETRLRDIAVPLARVPVVRAGDPLSVLLERMSAEGGTPAMVLDAEGRLAGIVAGPELGRAALFGMSGNHQPAGRW
ncbi:MAG TPA: site-2 protease family protein [Acidimicrobiales bacterium]|nr:site-2 protease family protein [Acidimicrobiales bacterium]